MPRMTYDQIQKQIAQLKSRAAKMESAQAAAKKQAVAKVLAFMKKLGVEVSDLKSPDNAPAKRRGKAGVTSGSRPAASKTRSPVAPKYRHPVSNETWTGRGKLPKWLSAEIAAGKSRDQFLISKP
jgi:DNA-binding protein H-NS